ncbi:MAG: DUF4270 domain-containing protein [Bacteroidaceae bacterium]|jgi:hypothetical protein|nr:DUF4270 domain-containing protein [Bacteroidaceae bacterium]
MNYICKNSIKILGAAFLCLCIFSCDDNTDTFGGSVIPSSDGTSVSQSVYQVLTKSLRVDSLVATSSDCYLGRVTDPETNATTTCNFLAQFYCLDNYSFPDYSKINKINGLPVADSVEMRLYIKSYYGDSLNSMKIGVYELDSNKIMSENDTYYTNTEPDKYVSKSPDAIRKEISFAVADLSLPDSLRYSSSYNKNIRIKLPVSYGSKIINEYYKHPEYFANSYNFIHHVVPGFYFKVISGNGTIVHIDVSSLSVYFKYTQKDSTLTGIQRVAATEEVLQNNYVDNQNTDNLLKATDYTYLKTPAGIFTEATLPIDDIYENHLNDSVNSAKIVFKRYNNTLIDTYNLPTPNYLLMILKSDMNSFFQNHKVPDSYKNYYTSFDQSYNSYTFSNIANLISYLKRLRDNGAGISYTDSETSRRAKIADWEAKNPEWNKIVLVPISTENSSLGAITAVHNDFSLGSTKLVGGENNPINISIVYSHFNR